MTTNTNHHAEHPGQTRDALFLLIRIYTPFICALIAAIQGILIVCGYRGIFYILTSEITGHSILLMAYIIATSKRMCIWYKLTTYMLFIIHIPNILYGLNILEYNLALCISISITSLALLSFLIYRLSVGITKVLCP